ncbi:MAG: O-antigen ligase family protein [Candidatus Omnitrophica bacterium]|nr:O-antigen ligase family protein [Candidatus Omnitrophota bacterium]
MKKENVLKILNFIIEYSLYGLIFFLPQAPALIEIFSTLAIVAFIIKKAIEPDFKFTKNISHLFLLLFLFFNILSFLNSGIYLEKSIKAFFSKWLQYIFIFLIVEDFFIKNPKKIKKVIFLILFMAFFVGLDCFFQKYLNIEFMRKREIVFIEPNKLYAVTGPFHHYNDLAAYLIFILAVVLVFLFKSNKIFIKFFLLIEFFILFFALLVSYSRGGWVGFLFIIILLLILFKKIKLLGGIGILFLIVLLFIPSVKERFLFTFSGAGDLGRFLIWKETLKIIRQNPFLGKGLGTYMDCFSKISPSLEVQYAHNCFLQIWAETGIFSLLSFLFFLFSIFLKAIKKFFVTGDNLILAFLLGIFGFLVHSFFDTHLYSLQLATLFWYNLGLLDAFIIKVKERTKQAKIKHK